MVIFSVPNGLCFGELVLPTPQMGQTQSSGSSLNALPSTLGSYSYPQTSQMYFAIDVVFNVIVFVFSVQRYKKYLTYANKYRKIVDFSLKG